MRTMCELCADLFGHGDSGIVSTPCGHVFHTHCLLQWMENSNTCPTCRGPVTENNIIKLFFNFLDDESNFTTTLENEIENLNNRIKMHDVENSLLSSRNQQLKSHIAKIEEDLFKEHLKVFKLGLELAGVGARLQNVTQLENQVQDLALENTTLVEELERVNCVRTVVIGCQRGTESLLHSMQANLSITNAYNASKHLGKFCAVLKRELDRTVDEKSHLGNRLANVQQVLGLAKAEVKEYEKDIVDLKKELMFSKSLSRAYTSNNSASVTSSLPSSSNKRQVDLIPISVPYTEESRKKMGNISVPQPKPASFSQVNMPVTVKQEEEESVPQMGYNEQRGHRGIIGRARVLMNKKPYENNPKASK